MPNSMMALCGLAQGNLSITFCLVFRRLFVLVIVFVLILIKYAGKVVSGGYMTLPSGFLVDTAETKPGAVRPSSYLCDEFILLISFPVTGCRNDVWKYDPQDHTWNFISGEESADVEDSDCMYFDPKYIFRCTNHCTSVGIGGRCQGAAVAYQNYMWYYGGTGVKTNLILGSEVQPTLYQYEVTLQTWKLLSVVPGYLLVHSLPLHSFISFHSNFV